MGWMIERKCLKCGHVSWVPWSAPDDCPVCRFVASTQQNAKDARIAEPAEIT